MLALLLLLLCLTPSTHSFPIKHTIRKIEKRKVLHPFAGIGDDDYDALKRMTTKELYEKAKELNIIKNSNHIFDRKNLEEEVSKAIAASSIKSNVQNLSKRAYSIELRRQLQEIDQSNLSKREIIKILYDRNISIDNIVNTRELKVLLAKSNIESKLTIPIATRKVEDADEIETIGNRLFDDIEENIKAFCTVMNDTATSTSSALENSLRSAANFASNLTEFTNADQVFIGMKNRIDSAEVTAAINYIDSHYKDFDDVFLWANRQNKELLLSILAKKGQTISTEAMSQEQLASYLADSVMIERQSILKQSHQTFSFEKSRFQLLVRKTIPSIIASSWREALKWQSIANISISESVERFINTTHVHPFVYCLQLLATAAKLVRLLFRQLAEYAGSEFLPTELVECLVLAWTLLRKQGLIALLMHFFILKVVSTFLRENFPKYSLVARGAHVNNSASAEVNHNE